MSNLNPFAAKKARHSLLLAAIKDRLGDNVISSSKAADLYAELLGYQNQSELIVKNKDCSVQLLKRLSIESDNLDWHASSPAVVEVFMRYIDSIDSESVGQLSSMTSDLWHESMPSSWYPVLVRHLRRMPDLRYLRHFEQHKQLSAALCCLRKNGEGTFSRQAEIRLIFIVFFLRCVANRNIISKVSFEQVFYLFQPVNFSRLYWYYNNSRRNADWSASERQLLDDYQDKDDRLVNPLGEEYLNEMYLSFVPLFEALTTGHDLDVVTEELAFIDERWF